MASCLAAEAVPMIISAPALRANWVAAIPTPPAAEWIKTRSRSRSPPMMIKAAYAVA